MNHRSSAVRRLRRRRPLIALSIALGLLAPMGASPATAAGDEVIVFGRESFVWTTDPSGSAPQQVTGGPRKDRLEGEGGSDTLIARDGIRGVVRGGPGSEKDRIDAGTDDVTGIETLLP